MAPTSDQSDKLTTTPNPLKRRDPPLFKKLARFRAHFGNAVLDAISDPSSTPSSRAQLATDLVTGLRAAFHVLRVLVKDDWSQEDLAMFDEHWRDALRSDAFGDEFECERHRIQACVDKARADLARMATPAKVEQPMLW